MTIEAAPGEPRRCVVCGDDAPLLLGRRQFVAATRRLIYRFEHEDVTCRVCAMVFSRTAPPPEFLDGYYRDAYTLASDIAHIERDYDADARVALLDRHVHPGARILEIGAGDADFCSVLDARGFEAAGVDPLLHDRPDARVATADHRATVGQFDAVVSYYVLEHVPDVAEWLRIVADRVAPNGVAIIEVPDFERHPQESLFWEHLQHLTPYHLCTLLRQARLTPIQIDRLEPSRYFGFTVVARRGDGVDVSPPAPPSNVYARDCYARGASAQATEAARANTVATQVREAVAVHTNAAVVVWAANEIATAVGVALTAAGLQEVRLVDSARQKAGRYHPGFTSRIAAPGPEELAGRHVIFVLCSPTWNDAIARQIAEFRLPSLAIIDAAAIVRGRRAARRQ